MQSIENKILNSVKKCGKGIVFSSNDFTRYGNTKSINKALESLANKAIFIRITNGLYCYPQYEKIYGLGMVQPLAEDIASAIARKNLAQIAPTGEMAQYQLGLTQQVPMNIVFLTDGSSRSVFLIDGRVIKFKHVSPKYFSFKDKTIMLITLALKSIGDGNITDNQLKTINKVITETKADFNKDAQLIPIWILKILIKEYAKISKSE